MNTPDASVTGAASRNAAESITPTRVKPKPFPSAPSSTITSASSSPPPTSRASFPSPGVKSYVGPKVKEGNCCDRDADLQAGAEISVRRVSECRVCGHTFILCHPHACHNCRLLMLRRLRKVDELRISPMSSGRE
jgi:hypothetical protein